MISRRIFIAATMASGLASTALAHGPTPRQAQLEIEVSTPPAAIWAVLADPASYADWHPDIASVTMEGAGQGAKRMVEFTEGGTVTDGIDRVDDAAMLIRWRLSEPDIEAFPASYYTNDISVEAAGEGSKITWKASFFRADTTNYPEERFSDDAAIEAMVKLMTTGLEGLKTMVEGSPPS